MRHASILFLVVAVVYGFALGQASLWDIDEAIYAEISRQMAESGDWVFPYYNGEPRFDKPPLIYWITALAMSMAGPTELAARVGSYLFALLSGLLVFALGSRFYSTRAGVLGFLVLASSLGWFIAGRIGLMDTGLSFFVGLCLYFIARIGDAPGRRNTMEYLGVGLAAALGVLTKGPVALVLFGGTALFYLWPKGIFRTLNLRGVLLSVVTFLVVALPWHLAIYARAGAAWWESYFGYHMFARFTQPLEEHGFPWYFYIIVLAVGFLPWTGYGLAAGWSLLSRRPPGDGPRLLATWAAFVFIFFSISRTKLPGYILPAFIPLAVLLGAWCDDRLRQYGADRAFSRGLWISMIGGLLAAGGLVLLRPLVPEGYEGAYRLLFVFPGTLVVGMLLTKLVHAWRKDAKVLLYGFGGTAFAAMLLFSALLMPLIEEFKPVKPLIEHAQAAGYLRDDTPLLSAMGDASSTFYARRVVQYTDDPRRIQSFLESNPGSLALVPETLVGSLQGVRILATHGPGVLVTLDGRLN